MFIKSERFPETAVFTKNCFEDDYIFRDRAVQVFESIRNSIDSFSKDTQAYYNNTIGILGGRGSGKTSLLKSVMETCAENKKAIDELYGEEYFIKPLTGLIDPKVLPNNISIVNYVLSVLYIKFKKMIHDLQIKEKDSSPVFQKFDELNESISLLTRVIRQDPIDNPSDLYDIGNIIKIRSGLEKLVEELLSFYKEDIKKSAFLVFIDDFDLDSSNIHNMVLDLSSFLSIKHLIFLTSFDPDVFSDEIIRQRIKIISDYGVNQFLRSDSIRFSPNQYAFFKVEELIDKAKKYEEQIYNKFIPHDFRIQVSQTSGYLLTDDKLNDILSRLTSFLFGFAAGRTPKIVSNAYQQRVYRYIREYCARFCFAIASTSDLRTRNQLLNQIVDSLNNKYDFLIISELKKNLEGMSKIVDSQEDKTLLSSVANQLVKAQPVETNDVFMRNQIVYEDGDYFATARDLAPEYWLNHPCASLLYNEIIKRIDLDESDYPRMFVSLFELFRDETIPVETGEKGGVATINGKEYYIDLFSHPSMNLNGKAIAKSIQLYVSDNRPIAKYQLGKYISLLEEYNASLNEEDKLLKRYISEMKDLASRAWKGADIRMLRSEARRCLSKCITRLQ